MSKNNILADKVSLFHHDIMQALGSIVLASTQINYENIDGELEAQLKMIKSASENLIDLLPRIANTVEDNTSYQDDVIISSECFLQRIEDRWSAFAHAKNVNLTFKYDDPPQWISVDRISFERLVNNLVNNAIKAAKNVTVSLSCSDIGTFMLTVQDDGNGIPVEQLNRAFSSDKILPLKKKNGKRGLLIVSEIISQMEARFVHETVSSSGTLLHVILPLKTNAKAPMPLAITNELNGLKILFAEDNATNQMVVKAMLETLGAKVTVVSDGEEAIKVFDKNLFDIVLLDIEMPKKTGIEVAKEIREQQNNNDTTLVAVTAYILPDHVDAILAAGMDGVVAKPITNIEKFGKQLQEYYNKSSIYNSEVANQYSISMDQVLSAIGKADEQPFLKQLRDDFTSAKTGLKLAHEQNDMPMMASVTHSLSSFAGFFGETPLVEVVNNIRQALKDKKYGALNELLAVCDREIEHLIKLTTDRIVN